MNANSLRHMQTYFGHQCQAFTALAFALRTTDRQSAKRAVIAARFANRAWEQTIDQLVDLEEREAA